jgi:hypothetical protein
MSQEDTGGNGCSFSPQNSSWQSNMTGNLGTFISRKAPFRSNDD